MDTTKIEEVDERAIEKVDEITNVVMDIVREHFGLNSDSDEDDELYTLMHNAIREIREVE